MHFLHNLINLIIEIQIYIDGTLKPSIKYFHCIKQNFFIKLIITPQGRKTTPIGYCLRYFGDIALGPHNPLHKQQKGKCWLVMSDAASAGMVRKAF
jgi:hypothetical protein